jgi:hypothetical protein
MTFKERVLQIAAGELGKCEQPKGSNWGADIKKYLSSVGITFPAAWCMAFVYWCINDACKDCNTVNPLFKTGHVLTQYNKNKKIAKRANPKTGDVFIVIFPNMTGHTGFVERVDEDYIYTIEGNTNDENSREGYEVARRKRARNTISFYLSLPIE